MAKSMSDTGKPTVSNRNGSELVDIKGAHVVAAYARWAPVYDKLFGTLVAAPTRIAVGEVNKLPPGRILELGVGTGLSLPLYDRKHRIVGIDLSRDMLERATKRVRDNKLDNVESILEMDAGSLAFGNGSFDTAMAMFVMTVVPDPDRVLAEITRVVKPGGRVIVVNHFSVDKGLRAQAERWLARFSSKLGWRPEFPIDKLLGRSDLKLIERRSVKAFDLFTMLTFERI